MSEITATERAALIRAIERRFGKSVLPYSFRRWAERDGWTIVDVESGSHVKGRFVRGRLVVTAHHDAALHRDLEAATA